MKKLIDLYAYRINGGSPEFLLLKRSSNKIYANQWRMIGGKVKADEVSWKAGLRELKEETGLAPKKYWAVPSINQFYEYKTDHVHSIPVFAAEINKKEVTLDDEHSDFIWASVDDATSIIKWPEQRRLIELIHHILTDTNSEILPEWIIDPSS